jgi:Subtilase family
VVSPGILAQSEDSFAMGKKTTNFMRSTRFETVTFYEARSIDAALRVVNPSRAVPLAVPENIGRTMFLPSLERFGVMLIELAPTVAPDAILPLVRSYNERGRTTGQQVAFPGSQREGNPIYFAGSVDYVLVNEAIVQFRKGTDPRVIAGLLREVGAEIVREPADIGREPYVVRFPGVSGHGARALSNRLDALEPVVYSQPDFVGIDPQRLPVSGQTSGGACDLICTDPVSTASSGDPFLVNQSHLDNLGTNGKLHADINAKKAWQITQGSPSIIVAILDDLVEIAHPDLQQPGKIHAPWNALLADGSASSLVLKQSDVHGTAVAGLAAAVANNGVGVVGIAPNVKIMPVRVFDGATFRHSAMALAIEHAADQAQVLSMSWTLGWESQVPTAGFLRMQAALQYASVDKGRVLVFSAGNDNNTPADYPASRTAEFPIIAVSATDEWDQLKKKVSQDPCGWGTSIGRDTVAAPGYNLHTTDRTGSAGYCTSGAASDYAKFDGTSAAVPLVAGTAALMLSADPTLTPLQVRTRLQQTAEHPNPGARPDDLSGWGLGWGRIDACRALQGTNCEQRGGTIPMPPGSISVDE